MTARPVRILALATVLAVASVAGSRLATATARKPSACQRMHGKDLAPARSVKLVERRNQDEGKDLLGCVLPRGRVRTLASSSDLETTSEDYSVMQVAGAIVLLTTAYDSQYGSDKRVVVVSVRSGHRYVVAQSCARTGEESCGNADTRALAAFVNRRGQAAAAITADNGQTTVIAAFSSRGKRHDLDSGPSAELPASSLALHGMTITWTHSGRPQTATIGNGAS